MRRTDRERLARPYGTPADLPTPGPAEALGVASEQLKRLEEAIFADFSPGPPFGIAWWVPGPGTTRRVLIGDQLLVCAMSTRDNLIEAALHWIEFLDYAEQESDMFADAVQVESGQVVVRAPRRERPLDDVVLDLCDLHLLGVARALSGALDCFAGVIIGVMALKTNILGASFGVVRRRVLPKLPPATNDGQRRQNDFAAALESLIARSGPAGWLDWVLDFRNMLIHRGRRLTTSQFVPRAPELYGPNGEIIRRARVVKQLPRDPGRSDVEVLRDPYSAPVLTEEAPRTLEGLIRSTRDLVDSASAVLLDAWQWRRANPGALSQPREQWPAGVSTTSTGFVGYAPGTASYSPSQWMSHPAVLRRLRTAALDDATRPQWATFD